MFDKCIVSNAFNKYFVEIGPQLERLINTTVNPLTYAKSSSNSMFMPYVEEHEIIEIVYKSHKLFIKNGLFPDELKITKVIPIFKNGYLIKFIDKHDILYRYQLVSENHIR